MALIGYTITVVAKQDNPYNVLPETDISIRKNSDNTLVNIYADEAGLIPIAQLGAKTDSNGQFTFYADASLGVLKAVWTNGGVIATEVLDKNDHSRLVNRNAVGAHDAIYAREFDSLPAAAMSSLSAGVTIKTRGRVYAGDGGASDYLVVTVAEYNALVGNSSGISAKGNGGDGAFACFDFLLTNGLVAYKLKRDIVFTEQLCDISSPSGVASAFVASGHHGGTLYHFPTVASNYITIDGSSKSWSLAGSGTINLADNQDNMILRVDNCTKFMSVSGVTLNGNKFNQSPASRNLGAGLRFYLCSGGYEAIRVTVNNNHSGAAILVIDNASNTAEYDAKGEIAFCRIRNAGDNSFAYSSDGIFVNSDRASVHDNDIDTVSDYALAFDYCQKTKVYNNVCKNFLVAMGIVGGKNVDIYGNTFDTGQLGIDITTAGNPATSPYISDTIKIYNNTVININVATALTGNAITVDASTIKAEVYNNTIKTFSGAGISCTANGAKVYGNSVFGNAGQTAYFIGGKNTRFLDNESDNGVGVPLVHNVANSISMIDDKSGVHQRTNRAITPIASTPVNVMYLRSTSTNAGAILTLRVAQNLAGIGIVVVERKLKCSLVSNTFSFSQLSIVGDSTITLTASPIAAGQASITANVTGSTTSTLVVEIELSSLSVDGEACIYLTDRLA